MNEKYPLSKKAIDLLDYNGYRFLAKEDVVEFKKGNDNIGVVVLITVYSFFGIPFILSFPFYGIVAFLLVFTSIYLFRSLFSKSTLLVIHPKIKKLEWKSVLTKRRLLSKHIQSVFIQSVFKSEYTSAFKSTSKEFKIIIGIDLLNDDRIELFQFISDHQEPSRKFLKLIVSLNPCLGSNVKLCLSALSFTY